MFDRILKDRPVVVILPADTWTLLGVNEPASQSSILLDRNGKKWMVIGIFMVKEDATLDGGTIEDEPEGVFLEVQFDKPHDDPLNIDTFSQLIDGTLEMSGSSVEIHWFLGDYSVMSDQFRFIFPDELYKVFYNTINYEVLK